MFEILEIIACVAFALYCLLSVVITILAKWVKNKMCLNASNDHWHYYLCEWYISPKSLPDRIAKKLCNSSFVRFADSCAVTTFGILIIVTFFLFLIVFF